MCRFLGWCLLGRAARRSLWWSRKSKHRAASTLPPGSKSGLGATRASAVAPALPWRGGHASTPLFPRALGNRLPAHGSPEASLASSGTDNPALAWPEMLGCEAPAMQIPWKRRGAVWLPRWCRPLTPPTGTNPLSRRRCSPGCRAVRSSVTRSGSHAVRAARTPARGPPPVSKLGPADRPIAGPAKPLCGV